MNGLPGCLGGAGKGVAQHDRVASEEKCFDDRTVALDSAISDQWNPSANGGSAFDKRLKLRHAEIRIEARRAPAPRTNAHLDAIDAPLDEICCAIGSCHVPCHEL